MSDVLLFPYTFEERKPTFLNPAFFVPEYYTNEQNVLHTSFSSKEWDDVFLNKKVKIEYCAGNGQWIIDRAINHPDTIWIAVERRYDRVKKIYKWIKRHKLQNCFVVIGNAEDFAKYHIKQEVIDEVYVNFPDPWPKARHAKNRLFKEPFLEDVFTSLKKNGTLILATDDLSFLEESIQAIKHAGFIPLMDEPYYQMLALDYGASFFENLWASKGKTNYITKFYKP